MTSNIPEIQDVLIVSDLRGTISSVSESVAEVLGYSPSELIGENIERLVPVGLHSKHRDHMTRYAQRPHARTMGIGLELNAVHAAGTLIPVEVSLRVLRGPEENLVRAVIRRSDPSLVRTDEITNLFARVRQLELTSGSLSEVFELVSELTSSIFADRSTAIWKYDSTADGYVIESVCNMPSDLVGTVTPRDEYGLITNAAFAQGVSIYSGEEDARRMPQFMLDLGLPGGIAATIGGRFEPFGAITVYFSATDALRLSDAVQLQVIATELSRFILSAQTEEALVRESELQAKLAEIGRIFSGSSELDEIYSTFAKQVRELIPFHRITLAEIDHSTQLISTRFAINADGDDIEGWESGTTHPLAGTSAEEMSKTKKGLFLNFADSEEFSRTLPGAPDPSAGLTGVLNVPLIVNGVVVGTLTLNTTTGQVFSEESQLLAERIAAQISGSFLSSSLSKSLELEAARRGSLNEIGEVIGSTLDISSVFPDFAKILKSVVPLDYVAITDVDVEAGTKIDILEYGDFEHEPVVEPLESSITGLVVSGDRLVSVSRSGLETEGRLDDETRLSSSQTFETTGMSAWVAAPLRSQNKIVGVLHTLSSTLDEYSVADCLFISQVASRVASAVANSRLHETAQEFARQQGVLAEISRVIGSSFDTSETFEEFAEILATLIPFDRMAVMNVDVSNETAETLYMSTTGKFSGSDRQRIDTPGTPSGYAAQAGETVLINDRSQVDKFPNWIGWERGAATSISVPMGRDGVFAKVFQLSTAMTDAYGPDEVKLIEQVANQISGAVANQQLYRRSMELAQERERSIRLEAERSRLASVNDAKTEFLNLLTHELKTPLTSIIAFADLLARGNESDLSNRQVQQLSVIQRNAWQLDALIQDLVDVSSIERGSVELEQVDTDISALVIGVLEGLTPSFQDRNQKLDVAVADEPVRANVDEQRITQVVSNLVSNASKYSPSDTTISVWVENAVGGVAVIVEDQGPGIPEADVEQVFELFHRVDNEATRQVPGTGQGLYLVRQLVGLHGGSVDIGARTDGGTGTRVVVKLPVV